MKLYHFIAIGGAVMHNLALALLEKGYKVTGSDDEIYEPSKTRLQKAGILPEAQGWFPAKIDATIDGIILGMLESITQSYSAHRNWEFKCTPSLSLFTIKVKQRNE
jgi:UDP-N-acetylmuramate-alanine ligase